MTVSTWPLTTPATVWTVVAVTNGWDHQQINTELKSWKLSNDLIKLVQAQRTYYQAAMTGTVDAMVSFAASEVIIRGASAVAQLLGHSFDETSALQQYRDLPIHNQRELAVNGGQLIQAGLQPGPALGQALKQLLTAVVTGELANETTQLIQAATADEEN
ncbi:tRNA nucleotidyltransferase domain-containing protein [Limosilactobacillus equigenerosi]